MYVCVYVHKMRLVMCEPIHIHQILLLARPFPEVLYLPSIKTMLTIVYLAATTTTAADNDDNNTANTATAIAKPMTVTCT